jgi:hypothetical protein
MLKYFKSFFVTESVKNNAAPEAEPEAIKNIVKYHYELKVNWYSNFMKFTTKIKSDTSDTEMDIYKILDTYIPQYSKLTIQERLIDYLYRTQTGMFADNFKSGVYHIDSLQIIKGVELDTGKIIYDDAIAVADYNISFEIYRNREWVII